MGKYTAMGWPGGYWGNSVELRKDIIESEGSNGGYRYKVITCPEVTRN